MSFESYQEQMLNKIVSIYFQLVLSNLLMIILIVYYLILIFDFVFNKISIKSQENTICIINSQKQDLDDCIKLCNPGTIIIFDDTNLDYLNNLCNEYIKKGLFKENIRF